MLAKWRLLMRHILQEGNLIYNYSMITWQQQLQHCNHNVMGLVKIMIKSKQNPSPIKIY